IGKSRMLVHPFTATYIAFSFIPTSTIVASPHTAIALDDFASFAVLQSRIHETWILRNSSTLKDDPRYLPSDCFETFPLPDHWRNIESLHRIGQQYYERRA